MDGITIVLWQFGGERRTDQGRILLFNIYLSSHQRRAGPRPVLGVLNACNGFMPCPPTRSRPHGAHRRAAKVEQPKWYCTSMVSPWRNSGFANVRLLPSSAAHVAGGERRRGVPLTRASRQRTDYARLEKKRSCEPGVPRHKERRRGAAARVERSPMRTVQYTCHATHRNLAPGPRQRPVEMASMSRFFLRAPTSSSSNTS